MYNHEEAHGQEFFILKLFCTFQLCTTLNDTVQINVKVDPDNFQKNGLIDWQIRKKLNLLIQVYGSFCLNWQLSW